MMRLDTKLIDMSKADSRDALLYAKLTADSGYQSEETHRVSPNQWARIVAIMNEPA